MAEKPRLTAMPSSHGQSLIGPLAARYLKTYAWMASYTVCDFVGGIEITDHLALFGASDSGLWGTHPNTYVIQRGSGVSAK